MQLVYFWIERNRVLENQEINLNSGFHFKIRKYNNTYILEREKEKEKKIPKSFFGEGIENISCIIGENGSGKTTLIDTIIKQKHFRKRDNFPKYIMVFEENNELFIYKNFNEIEIKFENKNLNEKGLNNFTYLYFNNDINERSQLGINNVIDFSPRRKIYDITIDIESENNEGKRRSVSGEEILRKYKLQSFRNLTEFLIKDTEIIKSLSYKKLGNKLEKIREKGEIVVFLVSDVYYVNDPLYREMLRKIGETTNNFIDKFALKSWEYISYCIFQDIINGKIEKEKILKIPERKIESMSEWFIKALKEIEKITHEYDDKMVGLQKKCDEIKFYESLTLDRFEIPFFTFFIELLTCNVTKIELYSDYFIFKYHEDIEIYEELTNSYRGYNIFNFRFKEELSTGEFSFLNFLVSLNESRLEIKDAQNIIFFIEEVEIFMHPEWQRKIIELMRTLKNTILWMKNINVQYIFTSHTPFLIGDIPGGNISYFKEGKLIRNEANTFGGNIYNILKESFLMDSCFGELAKEKIKKVIELLSKDDTGKYNGEEI